MPRNITSALKAHLAGDVLTVANLMLVTRTDGVQLGFTDHDQDIVYGGITYEAVDGFSGSALSEKGNGEASDTEVVGMLTSTRITDADLLAGRYRMADVTILLVNWANLSMGSMVRNRFKIANTTANDGASFKASLVGLSELLRQNTSCIYSRRCAVRRLGDLQCKVTLSGYQFARTVTTAVASLTGNAATDTLLIDCGSSSAVGSWHADEMYTGAYNTQSTGHTIDTSAVTNPAPMAVYQTARNAVAAALNFTYVLTGLSALAGYHLRLHFAEIGSPNKPGQRLFSVLCQGETALYNYDIFYQAGGQNIAVVAEFDAVADSSGHITLVFQSNVSHALVNGIEVMIQAEGNVQNGCVFGSDTQSSGYYNAGVCYWTGGNNAGLQSDIKCHIARSGSAYIQFHVKPPFAIQVGDTATLEAGCDRSRTICVGKFANGVNYHGQDLLPGNDLVSQVGR